MNTNQKISSLRSVMLSHGIDAVIIPTSDPHQSEYPASHWQERFWISGFTGSAGTVIITQDHAGCWVDSRYFTQAIQELEGTEMVMHKQFNQFEPFYVENLVENLPQGSTCAINGRMFSCGTVQSIKQRLANAKINLAHDTNLIDEIWTDRPPLSKSPVFIHETKFAGVESAIKINTIREKMAALGVQYHLLTALDDIAWTFNLRGNDVEYNPVFIANALITADKVYLCIDSDKVNTNVASFLALNKVEICAYDDITALLQSIEKKNSILIDPSICNQELYEAINAQIIEGSSIPKILKGFKNETEITNAHSVMARDGAAIANAIHWLEIELAAGRTCTEYELAAKLAQSRSVMDHYVGESFGAIIGYQENGAIIHYHPYPDTSKTIKAHGILLVDNGGQFLDGTTDITRTFALSTPTAQQCLHYTLILKGMVNLSMAVFPTKTPGSQLDTIARQFLWREGLNYLHGTGHGVGSFLNVHEPPQGFAPISSERGRTPFEPGMITSNEPGHYIEGQYGMRIENLMVSRPWKKEGYMCFETLTVYPFEHSLINLALLDQREIDWINMYHWDAYEKISPHLTGDVLSWFEKKCAPIKLDLM